MTMEGYRFGRGPIAADAPPRPVSLYAVSKLVGEAIAKHFAQTRGLSVICLRLGNVQVKCLPPSRNWTAWRQSKWLNRDDLCQAIERAILSQDTEFQVLPLVSNNTAMRWDLSETRRVLGYAPIESAAPRSPPMLIKVRALLGYVYKRLFDPAWRYYWD